MTPLRLQRELLWLQKGIQIKSGGKVKEAEEVKLLHLWLGYKGLKFTTPRFLI